jgi:hypothetical protein
MTENMEKTISDFEKRANEAIAAENVIVLKEGESVTGYYAGTITKKILGKDRKIVSVIGPDGIKKFYWSWGLLDWNLEELPAGSLVKFSLEAKRKNKKTGQLCNGCKFYAEEPDGHAKSGTEDGETEATPDGLPF